MTSATHESLVRKTSLCTREIGTRNRQRYIVCV